MPETTPFVRDFCPPVLPLLKELLDRDAVPPHHLDAFNLFVENGELESIVEQEVPISVGHLVNRAAYPRAQTGDISLRFHDAQLAPPVYYDEHRGGVFPLTPDRAVLTKRCYSGVVSVNASLVVLNGPEPETLVTRRVDLFRLPVMVGSNACHDRDRVARREARGGHFITKGTHRTLISFIRPNYNVCFVSPVKNDAKFRWVGEFRSRHQDLSILVKVFRDVEDFLFVSMPYIRAKIPAGVILVALGYPFDTALQSELGDRRRPTLPYTPERLAVLQAFLDFDDNSMERLRQQMPASAEEALAIMARLIQARADRADKPLQKLHEDISSEIFVHLGFGYADVNAVHLAYMLRLTEKTALGHRAPDDKDALANKRVDVVSDHLAQLVRASFRRACKSLPSELEKHLQRQSQSMQRQDAGSGQARRRVCKSKKKKKKAADDDDADDDDPDFFFAEALREDFAEPLAPTTLSEDAFFETVTEALLASNMTRKIDLCMATGRWEVANKFQTQKPAYAREGVSQVLSQANALQRLSHLHRITQPIATESINFKIHNPRQFSPSQNGFLCPFETPEGGTVGIVCNLALTATASLPFNPFVALAVVRACPSFRASLLLPAARERLDPVLVVVNGQVVGHALRHGTAFVEELRRRREQGALPRHVGIVVSLEDREVRISSDAGRFIRPLLVVDAETQALLWRPGETLAEAERRGHLVYADAGEIDRSVVAVEHSLLGTPGRAFDYAEIHPVVLFGHNASLTNYSNCNQAPRNSYVCSQNKHAMAAPTGVGPHLAETNAYALRAPQAPLVSTMTYRLLRQDESPAGVNLMVAVMTHKGFNQEDSVILNRASIQRGLLVVDLFHVVTDRERPPPGDRRGGATLSAAAYLNYPKSERWEPVPEAVRNCQFIHEDLDARGIVLPHRLRPPARRHRPLDAFQVLVSKRFVQKADVNGARVEVSTDQSLVLKPSEAGCFVEDVRVDMDEQSLSIVRITLRYPHTPEVGDKVASSHGQKGIVGAVMAEEDLPFDADGNRPDLIINPHAFPSRMTINYLMEMGMGLMACRRGLVDATPFEHDVDRELALAEALGVDREGRVMMDGQTGRRLPQKIFFGTCYYHALNHLVSKKMYSRSSASSGPVDAVRQPVSGRSREGGLRCGEMERDCLMAHGAAATLSDRLLDCSDKWTSIICDRCRDVTFHSTCHQCGRADATSTFDCGFSSLVLMNRLKSMGIRVALSSDRKRPPSLAGEPDDAASPPTTRPRHA